MKLQPLSYDITRKHRYKSDYEYMHSKNDKMSAGLCENNDRGYSIAFSGGLNKSEAAANTFMGKILKSGAFNWLAEFSGAHNIASSALISLFLAGLLRPAATLALPGKKDKDDKTYSAAHAVASGVIGFIFSTIITSPLDSGSKFMIKDGQKMHQTNFEKLTDKEIENILINKYNVDRADLPKYFENEKAKAKETIVRKFEKGLSIITSKTDKIDGLKNLLKQTTDSSKRKAIGDQIRNLDLHMKSIDTTMHNVVDWGIAIPRATLTIALIPPILKYVFRLEKKKKPEQTTTTEQVQLQPQKIEPSKSSVVVSMKDYMGGLKNEH